eukprot:scaffold31462_cov20-Prasinocladus_malaysianus.AAC.2
MTYIELEVLTIRISTGCNNDDGNDATTPGSSSLSYTVSRTKENRYAQNSTLFHGRVSNIPLFCSPSIAPPVHASYRSYAWGALTPADGYLSIYDVAIVQMTSAEVSCSSAYTIY